MKPPRYYANMEPETDQRPQTALVLADGEYQPGLSNAIRIWADATTAPESTRRRDLSRDKRHAVADFFSFIEKHPTDVSPLDVKAWQADLEARKLRPNTVYVRTSFLSSFYAWAMRDPDLGATSGRTRLVSPDPARRRLTRPSRSSL